MKDPIRIFIGVDGPRSIAAEVLKYSVMKHTKREVHFFHLDDTNIGEKTNNEPIPKMYTGFSFYRWAIPLLCDFKGKAIYLDADIFNFHDIQDLWETDMGDHTHMCYKEYASVMLIDCEKAQWPFVDMVRKAAKDKNYYSSVMWCRNGSLTQKGKGNLLKQWNYLDSRHAKEDVNKFYQIHYTKVPTQPWAYLDHPLGYIFYDFMKEAIEYGFISEKDVNDAIECGACHKDIRSKLV